MNAARIVVRLLLVWLLSVTGVSCVVDPNAPVDAGAPDLSQFVQKGDTPLWRDRGTAFLKRWLLCGDGFMVWNQIGFVEIAESRKDIGAVVTAQIADTTPHASESGFKWGQLSGSTLFLGDINDFIHVFDLSDHSAPRLMGSFAGYAGVPLARGMRLLFASENTVKGMGYQVIDATDPTHPVYGDAHMVRSAQPGFRPGGLGSFHSLGDRLFAWDATATALFEMDTSNPFYPRATSVVQTATPSLGGGFMGDLYVANTIGYGWKVIDVHEPGNAVMLIDAVDFNTPKELQFRRGQELPLVRGGVLFKRDWVEFKDEFSQDIGGRYNPIWRYTLSLDGTPIPHSKLPLPEWPAIGNKNPTTVEDVCWDGTVLTVVGDRITFWQQAGQR